MLIGFEPAAQGKSSKNWLISSQWITFIFSAMPIWFL